MSGQSESRKVERNLPPVLHCIGCISYSVFSASITVPKLYVKWTGRRCGIIADILWFNAHIGIGLYIYRQNFLKRASAASKVVNTTFCTVMFNFGSALIWGTVRSLLPVDLNKSKLCFGFGSGVLFMYIGWSLVQYLNSLSCL